MKTRCVGSRSIAFREGRAWIKHQRWVVIWTMWTKKTDCLGNCKVFIWSTAQCKHLNLPHCICYFFAVLCNQTVYQLSKQANMAQYIYGFSVEIYLNRFYYCICRLSDRHYESFECAIEFILILLGFSCSNFVLFSIHLLAFKFIAFSLRHTITKFSSIQFKIELVSVSI